MQHPDASSRPFRVGSWLCEPLSFRLSRGDDSTQIEPKQMHVLECLAARPGQVVTRRELLDTVWADTIVTEQVLSRAVSELRKVFDDDPRTPRVIETIAKSGYRLLPPVEMLSEPGGADPTPAAGVSRPAGAESTPAAGAGSRAGGAEPTPAAGSGGRTGGAESTAAAGAPKPVRSAPHVGWRSWVLLPVGIGLGIALASLMWRGRGPGASSGAVPVGPGTAGEPLRLSLLLPADAPPELSWFRCFELTPDGRSLFYTANKNGRRQIYRVRLDDNEAVPVHGTEGGYGPFLSRDGTQLAFLVAGDMRRVALDGGQPVTLCNDVSDPVGATWSEDGTLVFTRRILAGLSWIPPDQKASALTRLNPEAHERSHFWPHFLPGGEHVLLTVWRGGSIRGCDIELLHVASGERRMLIDGGSDARYVPDGRVLFARAGTLLQVGFDLERLQITGSPTVLAEDLFTHPVTGAAHYAVADNGTIVYVTRDAFAAGRELQQIDPDGHVMPLVESRSHVSTPRLSPDGTRLAATVSARDMQIWLIDVQRGGVERLTRDGFSFMPAWRRDGTHLAFSSDRQGPFNLYVQPARADEPARRLTENPNMQFAGSWSPDGRLLAYAEFDPDSRWDVWLLPMDGAAPGSETPAAPIPFLVTPFDEFRPSISPDGRALAYVSNESGRWDERGRWEVYVRLLEDREARVQISTDGGTDPNWSVDGTRLFFRRGATLLETEVRTTPTLSVGSTRVVHENLELAQTIEVTPTYDVARDGRVIIVGLGALQPTALTVLLPATP